MSIQKKSLISALKTAKKANVASSHDVDAKGAKVSSMRHVSNKKMVSAKNVSAKASVSAKHTVSLRKMN